MTSLDQRLNALDETRRARLLTMLKRQLEERGGANDVRALYERHPFPLPTADIDPLYDVAVSMDSVLKNIDGQEVLDAGCGTGHRLIGLARAHPRAKFLGVDFSDHSLEIGRALARRFGCENVEFRHAEIGGPHLGREFDLALSTGVIHHLEDPAAGAEWVQGHVKPDGASYTWYYHAYGEFGRLLDRDLALLLMQSSQYHSGAEVLTDLGLSLGIEQYGKHVSHAEGPSSVRAGIDADAYLHPIVNAYMFEEAAGFFRRTADWSIVVGVNWEGGSGVVDVTDWSGKTRGMISADSLFDNDRSRAAFCELDYLSMLKCLELKMRPTGFTLLTGKAAGLDRCTARAVRNAEYANLLGTGPSMTANARSK